MTNRENAQITGSPVRCELCPRHCEIRPGKVGICKVRTNRAGTIELLKYGRVSALALDPIEKKPLFHFHPGKWIFSVGTFGCNMRCPFCQNAAISMTDGERADRLFSERAVAEHSPEELVEMALSHRSKGNIGVAFTYNEPLVALEYVRDTFELAREAGLETVLVSNGCFEQRTIETISPLTTAWNIDLKAFTTEHYRALGGDLETVKNTIRMVAPVAHLEVTTLIVPNFNDSLEELDELAGWLASVNPNIPLHLSRFFPNYKVQDERPTDLDLMMSARKMARNRLRHVHLGNCP